LIYDFQKQVHALLQKDLLVDRAVFEGAIADIKYQYVMLSVLVQCGMYYGS